jgi:predicted nucleic acid-binding protein
LIVLDSSAMFAALVRTELHHERASAALEQEEPPFVLSPFVLCELDYLLATSVGTTTELALLDEVSSGAYELAAFDGDDVAEARRVIDRYRDLEIGLADASIVVLSKHFQTNRVFTLDERHFRALRGADSRPFVVVPGTVT